MADINGGRTCANCRFRRLSVGPDKAFSTYCYRYPPTLCAAPVPTATGDIGTFIHQQYPNIVTPAEQWCGEWVAELN